MKETISKKNPLYEIEKIVSKAKIRNKWHYLIKWKGYSKNESTWEPVENLKCPELLRVFELRNKRIKSKLISKKHKDNNLSMTEKTKIKEKKKIVKKNFESREGSIELDIPNKIISAKVVEKETGSHLLCFVEWKEKKNLILQNSYVTNLQLKEKLFNEVLINFYESKMYFQNDIKMIFR